MTQFSNSRSISRYILRPLILATAFFLTLITTNYFVDPANLFWPGRARGIAKLLATGWNAANVATYNERRLQEQYVGLIQERRKVVAFGSSRSKQIKASHVGTSSFFNSGVGAAVLQDHLGIYNIYRKRGLLPDVLIIGLDPWVLNRQHGQTAWETIRGSVVEAATLAGVSFQGRAGIFWTPSRLVGLVVPARYAELASPSYFQLTLEQLSSLVKNPVDSEYYSTTDRQSAKHMILSDGSWVYGSWRRSRTVDQVIKAAAESAKRTPDRMDNFERLDPNLRSILEAFIELLVRDGVKPVFFLPPYHPVLYRTISKDYPIVSEAEVYYRNLAAFHQIPVVGGYDPVVSGCEVSECFDPIHPKPNAVRKIFAALNLAPFLQTREIDQRLSPSALESDPTNPDLTVAEPEARNTIPVD